MSQSQEESIGAPSSYFPANGFHSLKSGILAGEKELCQLFK